MYVLMDMEWVTNKQKEDWPTQIAAARVDRKWNTLDTFSAVICPRDSSFHQWYHISFQGWQPADFMGADKAEQVFHALCDWLQPDDILCWWNQAASDLFHRFLNKVGCRKHPVGVAQLSNYVFYKLAGQEISISSPYQLCSSRGIAAPLPQHDSRNDVKTLQLLLQGIDFSQSLLQTPCYKLPKGARSVKNSPVFPYLYDPDTNTLHTYDCEQLHDGVVYPACTSFKDPIRKHYRPCACCRTAFYEALRERNRDIISRSKFNYVYSTQSDIFHRRSCSRYLLSYALQGAELYDTCKDKGLRPCKCCRPEPTAKPVILSAEPQKQSGAKSAAEQKAIARFLALKAEREQALQRDDLTETEYNRMMAFTQPAHAFWAARGYRTFHSRNCPQLAGLHELTGFSRYQDAIRAGHTPCRRCKPTSRQDVQFSIPITSRERPNDTCETLADLCARHDLPCDYDGQYFSMETKVGKWKIEHTAHPIRLLHVNLVNNSGDLSAYHVQPRLFLSLQDAFDYILRHDETLMKRLLPCRSRR